MAYGRRDFFRRTVGKDAWQKLAGLAARECRKLVATGIRSAGVGQDSSVSPPPRSAEDAGRALRSMAGKRKAPHPLTRGLAGASSASQPHAAPPRRDDQASKRGSAKDADPPS